MKKLLFSIAVFCYTVASAGVVVNMHYCMNRYQSLSFYETKLSKCGSCGMEKHGSRGCCHDEVLAFKMHGDQQAAIALHYDFSLPLLAMPPRAGYLQHTVAMVASSVRLFSHSPPLSRQDTYLRNNVFRI